MYTAIGRAGAWILRNRTLMRAPVWLYRARLGFLFGSRTLMLQSTGRKSGVRRYVVLEVVGHPTADTYVVASGFGERAQWFRNLIADPHARVSISWHRPRAATARRLSTDECDAVLAEYARHHPGAWAVFRKVLENALGKPIAANDTALPMVELKVEA